MDIRTWESEAFANSEFATAGFPCPDIAISGGRKGFSGKRSSPFAYLSMKVAEPPTIKMLLLTRWAA